MRLFWALVAVGFIFGPGTASWAEKPKSALVVKNTFARPEDVLAAFLNYDEQGYIWAGMSDLSREALTQWKEPPSAETFYRYSKRDISKTQWISAVEARIPVTWTVVEHRDGFGTQLDLPKDRRYQVVFTLKKDSDGRWRIHSPRAESYRSVLRPK
jgi:hypothetical protein